MPEASALPPPISDTRCNVNYANSAKDIDGVGGNIRSMTYDTGLARGLDLFCAEQKANGFADAEISRAETVDGDHGRIETRTTTVIQDVEWLRQRHKWPGLNGVVIVESSRQIDGAITSETRIYITSLRLPANLMGPIVRDHWSIENKLHWVMDMIFRDDECRVRTDHAPANFTTLKHMALNLIRRAPSKVSIRLRRKVAAWDDNFLACIIAG